MSKVEWGFHFGDLRIECLAKTGETADYRLRTHNESLVLMVHNDGRMEIVRPQYKD